MPPNADKPGWMATQQSNTKKGGKWVRQDTLEYRAVKERIKATYDIELAKFKDTNPLSLTLGDRNKIGTRNRRIEHIALTSPDPLIRDALTFVFLRTSSSLRNKKNGKKTAGAGYEGVEPSRGMPSTCHPMFPLESERKFSLFFCQ